MVNGAPDGAEGPGRAAIQRMFREFAGTTTARAPLYARLAAGIADDADIAALLLAAPPPERVPVLLLACVHDLLLADPTDELAAWYPNLTSSPADSDPMPAFRRFCARRRDELIELIAHRVVQTNEVGRSALLLVGFGLLAAEVGALAHVDVGTSGGLNLLLPRYHYEYVPGGAVGPPSVVTLICHTRGAVPVPPTLPTVAAAVGLDRAPVDLGDETAARWLEACVWPDQTDRFHRLVAAIELARAEPPDVRRGDAIVDTPALVAEVGAVGHPVVTSSWVLNYLTPAARREFFAALERAGAERDLSWVYAESPAQIGGLPVPADDPTSELTALMLVTWRSGVRTARHLGNAHPHGYWLHAAPNP